MDRRDFVAASAGLCASVYLPADRLAEANRWIREGFDAEIGGVLEGLEVRYLATDPQIHTYAKMEVSGPEELRDRCRMMGWGAAKQLKFVIERSSSRKVVCFLGPDRYPRMVSIEQSHGQFICSAYFDFGLSGGIDS